MTDSPLTDLYRRYLDCLNARDLDRLGTFVHDDVRRNGEVLGLSGYREMLLGDYRSIPDLRFTIELLVADTTHVAARLVFDCTPRGEFLGIPVDGRRVAFTENVFYRFAEGRIAEVWSLVDRAAIERQLAAPPQPRGAGAP